jgi:hypothetical protein
MDNEQKAARRRHVTAIFLAVGAALGVVQAMPAGTEWWRAAAAACAAAIPVLLTHWSSNSGREAGAQSAGE